MGAPSKKPNIATFRKIANSCGGILSDIAAHIGVDRVTVYAWCNDDPEFKQALEDSRERFLDLAESNLRKLVAGVPAIEKDENGEKRFAGWIERPSETAIIFTLKTRGKKTGICRTSRGYRSRWCRTYSTSHSLSRRGKTIWVKT